MDLEGARSRIRERSELKAFIAVSHEHGSGDVVAVKDLVDVAGMVTTAGGVILPDTAAEDDAPVIARLRQVGCVVVGKANLHEFAYGVTSLNPHIGYERAAALAKEAFKSGKTIRELCREQNVLPEGTLKTALDPWSMTKPHE